MKKFNLFGLVLGVLIGSAGVLASCNSNNPSTSPASSETSSSSTTSKEAGKITAVKIDNSETSYYVGDTVNLTVTVTASKDDVDKSVSFSSNDENVATVTNAGLVSFIKEGTVTITATSTFDSSKKDEINFTVSKKGATKITIDTKTTSGRVGDTIKLEYTVEPAKWAEDVTVSVSDSTILKLEEDTITLLKAGTASINVVSNYDATIKDSLEIKVSKVLPTAIKINNSETNWYISQSFDLDYSFTPLDCDTNVIFTSSNEKVATVENGKVSLVGEGSAVITVASKDNSIVKDSITVNVINPDFVINKTGLTANMDYSHMNDTDPYVQTKERLSRSYAMFNVTSTKYYAEATLSLLEDSGADWDGLGIGSATADSGDTARAFYFGPNFIGDKGAVCGGFTYMSNEDAIEWGASVFTSRNWIKDGTVDKTNVKLAVLRNGNDYYYLLNDSLRWFENNSKFDNTPTYPTIFAKDTSIKITNWSVTTDSEAIDAKLTTQEYKRNLFVSDIRGHTTYSNSDEFTFTSDYSTFFPSTAVKSIGDKALLSGDFTVEYDLSNVNALAENSSDENARVGVALMRRQNDRVYTDTFFVSDKNTNKAFDHRLVNYDPVTERNGPHEYYSFNNRTTAQGDTVNGHYKLTRTINGTTATLKLYFENVEKLSVNVDFTGECYLMFGSNLCSGTFKNVTFQNNI